MPTSDESDAIAAFLARQGGGRSATAAQIAASVAATCEGIADALTPIIGTRGVAALLHRSVHIAGQTHVWMSAAQVVVPATVDLPALTALLARQSPADAAAGGGLLLHTFHALLASQVGASLTERLLRSVWAPFLGSPPLENLQ